MPVTKSEIINKTQKNFPNLLKKDLTKFLDIILFEITKALSNKERVELRDLMTLETKIQKSLLWILTLKLQKFALRMLVKMF